MGEPTPDWDRIIARIYREDRRRVLASLIRLLGDFELAEEAVHDAFAAAVEQWPQRGLPDTPWTWLVSAGRFRTIDRLRRRARFHAARGELARMSEADLRDWEPDEGKAMDESLSLIFTCCHPALPPDAQVALTLREVCGLTTEDIASAFLSRAPTIAQRIVRAKTKIRDDGLPYEVPPPSELPDRLESVLRVVYLLFNEGYTAAGARQHAREELAEEAVRLGRLIADLLPDAEALGLLSLMLLQHSRRAARLTPVGDFVLLADQDRSLWDHSLIKEGLQLLDRAWAGREIGSYGLQAAIAAEQVRAPSWEAVNWRRVVGLYDMLLTADSSPVVALNRAAAIGMRDGPEAGLVALDRLVEGGNLAEYYLLDAARADLFRRLGRWPEAARAYESAMAKAGQGPHRSLLQRRLVEAQGYEATSKAEINSTSDS